MRKTTHKCEYCGKEFYGFEKVKYCSKECRDAARQPQLVELVCECCGKHYKGKPLGGKQKHLYCSEECRVKLKNRAKQQKLIDERQEVLSHGVEGEDYVVCQICGYKAVQLNNAHLMNEHGITIAEYKEQFPDAQLTSKKYINDYLEGEKNPMHASKRTEEEIRQNSPFSKEFYISRGIPEEERDKLFERILANKTPESYTGNLEYFTSRGYTMEQAIEMRREMHSFTLEKCIRKYGEEEGYRRFKERQEKWVESMKKHRREHPDLIYGTSVIANDFIAAVIKDLDENDFLFGKNEYVIESDDCIYMYDLTNLENKKIVEFNGDMWHGNPTKYTIDDINPLNHEFYEDIWARDKEKIDCAKDHGFDVLVIWEDDYRRFPERMIEQARHFLLNKPLPSCSI